MKKEQIEIKFTETIKESNLIKVRSGDQTGSACASCADLMADFSWIAMSANLSS